ncbi:MAG: hypothetical protein SW833_08540 [Cyanobacteriota bacterium]|nr:hypothetical protein [Cyanobacteriota bacterium]
MLCPSFFPQGAIAQSVNGPLRWNDPGIQWTPGASEQSYNQFSCPGNPNRVTISFEKDYDRLIGSAPFPVDFNTEIGTGPGPQRDILFTAMGNPPSSNPGRLSSDRKTEITITFDSPVSLGNFFVADIDRDSGGNDQWIDEIEVTANNGALIPGTAPGTSFVGVAGSVVTFTGNTATGNDDSPNAGPNSDLGNVTIDFGPNPINSIEITYRNAPGAAGEDGKIAPQAIALGDISFANPCLEVTKRPAGPPTDLGGGVFALPYTLTVENSGNVDIDNVQVAENLAQELGLTLGTAPLTPGQYRVTQGPDPEPTAPILLQTNPNFNGSTDTNLLISGTLDEGQSQTVNFTLEVYPTRQPIALDNQVVATGIFTPPGGIPENLSDEATASVILPPGALVSPQIGVAKAAGLPVPVGGDLFEIPYTLRVQNYGDTRLIDVQVTENLENAPPLGYGYQYVPSNPSPGQYAIADAPNATGTLRSNSAFTGSNSGSVDLLNPNNSTLNVGQSETITFTVLVNPIELPTILNNQVRASALNSNNVNAPPVTDDSVNDPNTPTNPNPDPDGDENPNNNQSPTPVPLPPTLTPRIGVAKSATNVVDATPATNDGLFDIDYVLLVENFGNIELTNIQLTDDFASLFGLVYTPNAPGIGQYTLLAPPTTTAPLAINPNFTGSDANIDLLNPAGSTLAVGQRQTINLKLQVNIDPANLPLILDNQARATGDGGGQTVSDLSNDGEGVSRPDPDPDGDRDPRNNDIPTRVPLPINAAIPRIGIAKESPDTAPPIVELGDGRFNIPYTIVVENAGTEDLNNVQVTENFEAADPFGFGLTYVSGTPQPGQYTLLREPTTSSPVTINPAFTGSPGGSIELLDAARSRLEIGQRREIDFTVQVFPSSIPVTLNNQARATGTGATSGQGAGDDSVDGLDTSPDSDLDPNNNSAPTPVILPPRRLGTGGEFILVKRITGVTRDGQALPGVDLERFVDDPNDSNDNQMNGTPLVPVGLANVEGLQSGDEVEYTIYYFAGGRQSVTNARICDLVPERTTFMADEFGGEKGILLRQGTMETAQTNAGDGDRGQFFSPLAPVNSAIPPCPGDTANPNGAVLVNLGNIPNTGPNRVGFFRFRVRLD